ncbi:TLD domain-containing protein, partial [Klebsiella aerogenes]|uniref:TLD domain-containing protein n=1 Tax=Klebsiella aerogenes TaxID=548 RepID=UPI001CC612C9|nr:hypothetical protein [Klebsiella aerogenes]
MKSFLFQLSPETEMFEQVGSPDKTICNVREYGPIFGERDLYIRNAPNKEKCYSNLGISYRSNNPFSDRRSLA